MMGKLQYGMLLGILWSGVFGSQFSLGVSADGLLESSPQAGLLVLTNGSILKGVVSLEGELYRVMLPKGELMVRATQVDFFSRSLDEAYARRRERSRVNSADSHVELARWCVQNGMLEHAWKEISEARSLDSRHQTLDVLTRQVEQISAIATKNVEPELLQGGNSAQVEPAQKTPLMLAHEIPQWARVEFVRRIQPMLIHTCAAGGCHNPGSSHKLQLDREALAGIGSPELIQRNLDSVIRTVNFDEPETSLLLARGLATHGTQEQKLSPAFTPRQIAILRAWITQLTNDQVEEVESEIASMTDGESVIDSIHSAQPGRHDVAPRHHGARDPFDPALFNRKSSQTSGESHISNPLPVSDRPPLAVP